MDVTQVPGTGPGGRLTQDDVKEFAKRVMHSIGGNGQAAAASGVARPAAGGPPLPDFSKWGEVERKAMSGIRRKTAEHLSHAWNAIPHVTQFDKADITALEQVRKKYRPEVEKAGGNLTVTAVAVKVIASALKVFPQFNASVDAAGEAIVYKKYINVGIAVDTENGLLVPVIRNADQKNLIQLSVEIQQLAEKAKARKLTLDEMSGGSMSISNLGGIGGTAFTPIINWPEVAILGISRGTFEPVWNGATFDPKQMLPLSLSYDHRLIDGADAIRFLRWVVEALENPFALALRDDRDGLILNPVRQPHRSPYVTSHRSHRRGPGGYAAAFYAADLGMKVTLIDNEKNPGGVCLYRGCIPSKALLHVAKVLDESKHAKDWGIEFGEPKVDVNKLRDFKNRVVEKLTSGTGQVSKFRKVNYLQGWASIVDPKTIKVKKNGGGEETVSVDYMILALGSLPTKIPALTSDSPRVLDSTSALELPEVPKSMLVIGGGYIGLELGSVYAALGTRVSVVEMTPGLLPGSRSRSGQVPRAARREDVREGDGLDQGHVDEGLGHQRHRDVRGRGRAERSDLRLRAGVDRPPAECEDRRPRQDEGQSRREGFHRDQRASAAPRSRRSSRSATWPASRCWRTRRRTKRAWPWKRLKGRRRSSIRRRFRPWCSPIPKSRGPD